MAKPATGAAKITQATSGVTTSTTIRAVMPARPSACTPRLSSRVTQRPVIVAPTARARCIVPMTSAAPAMPPPSCSRTSSDMKYDVGNQPATPSAATSAKVAKPRVRRLAGSGATRSLAGIG